MSFRKVEIKRQYAFMAIKDKAMRTFRVKALDDAEAKSKARKKSSATTGAGRRMFQTIYSARGCA